MKNKIDFVILWVDGSDEKWLNERRKYDDRDGDKKEIRFRDWDNLQYWFRGIEKFTPWVNKVHFVTWGHLPDWLDTNHPKLNIVNHSDITDKEYLPLFNSCAIEVNIHKIPGLAEQFVYFNDDMFVIKKMRKKDFFKNGLPCDNATPTPITSGPRTGIGNHISNNMSIINRHFNKRKQIFKNLFKWYNIKYGKRIIAPFCMIPWKDFASFATAHFPHSFLKSTFTEVWNKEKSTLEATSKSRFRTSDNVNQWLMRYWQLALGNFHPRDPQIGKNFMLGDNNKKALKAIQKQQYKMICLNDTTDISNFEKEKKQILNAFHKILPKKSSYEI